ncbi:MAG: hypothetical protein ACE5I1_11820, partial [bacterium]
MLKSLNYIITIAANERRLLYRTAKFWLLAGAGIFVSFMILFASTIATLIDSRPPDQFMLEGSDGYLALFFFSF